LVKGIRGVVGFVRTVEAGSFAGAAKKLRVTPVAVSKNVQRLERQLGVRLLHRSTRKLSLTEEGRAYYERCTGPLRELENAQSAIAKKRQISNRRAEGDVPVAFRTKLCPASHSGL